MVFGVLPEEDIGVNHDRLSRQAECILDQAEEAEVEVLVPTLVLAEVTYIAQKKRVKVTIDEVLKRWKRSGSPSFLWEERGEVEETLYLPEAIIPQEGGRFIAQRAVSDHHLRRVVYREKGETKVVITFYPARRGRYEGSV